MLFNIFNCCRFLSYSEFDTIPFHGFIQCFCAGEMSKYMFIFSLELQKDHVDI